MNTFSVSIVTPSGRIFSTQKAEKLSVRTQAGQIQILAGHTPLVSVLKIGQLVVEMPDDEHRSAVFGGFLEVRESGEVIILADEAEQGADIDVAQAEAAQRETQRLISSHKKKDATFHQLQSDLQRSIAQVQVGSWYQDR
ncbi:MAG: ATP synthase F1 subunit epsilon [Candidatus Paceibacterota bacterium]